MTAGGGGRGAAFRWRNPVLRGLCPDPSVIRVGRDYFVAVSTFDHLPGIRLFHSCDLVRWTGLGGAVTRPAQYRRDGHAGPINLFAPTLRHHAGRFHLVCTNVAPGQGNFLLSADDPVGPWSDAIWLDADGFDPSLFFDEDGTCYYTRRTLDLSRPGGDLGPVVQGVLDPETGALGPMRPITPGRGGYCSNDIEGPHLYRRGGWYYLFAAEGGTWQGHMQTVARSRSPWGPFVGAPHNPVLTHRHRVMHPVQSLGHADLVEDPHGGWWALALGTRHRGRHHLLGRETFLLPVDWSDGWPQVGRDGGGDIDGVADRSPATGGPPRPPGPPPWAEGWACIGAMPDGVHQDGDDLILPSARGDGDPTGPGLLVLPQTEPEQQFAATLPTPAEGGMTGIGVRADDRHVYSLCLSIGGSGPLLSFRRQADDLVTEDRVVWQGGLPVRLRIEAGPDSYRFFAADPAGAERQIGAGSARLLSAESCEWFTGVCFALIARAPGGGSARFASVHRTGPGSE